MSNEWDFYRLRVDDEPASIFLDMGIASAAPIARYPQHAYLRVPMLKPRDDGLSSQEEFDLLSALEDQVTANVSSQTSAIYVGRNTSSGNRDFYFYVESVDAFEAAVATAMASFPQYAFEVGGRPDPEWRAYFDFLYPSPFAKQQMSNRSVLQALAENGDRSDQPRSIDHLVVFSDAAKCAAFARQIVGQGYQISPGSPAVEDGEVRLEFSKIGIPVEIDDIALPLFSTALDYDGDYDGWGCEVVN